MFFNQDSTNVLKAKLSSTAAVSQVEISVTYKDNTDAYHPDAIVATDNTTAVTLLDAPPSGVINIVELIKIYNPDTQANIVQILANDTVIFTCTVGAGESALLSQEGAARGFGYVPANVDLDNLTSTGKANGANLAMPSDTYIDLTLGAGASSYIAPADGYLLFAKAASASGQFMTLYNKGSAGAQVINQQYIQSSYAGSLACTVAAKKGDYIFYDYNLGGATVKFRFIYAEGSQP